MTRCRVVGHRVLVKPDEVEHVSAGGIHLVLDEVQARASQQVGTIIKVGPMSWRAFDRNDPNWQPWAKVGDKVIYTKYGGKFVTDPDTKEKYVVLNDEDITVVIDPPSEETLSG